MSNKLIIVGSLVLTIGVVVAVAFMSGGTGEDGRRAGSLNGEGGLAPNFVLNLLGGGKVALADYRGEKPVVIDFWASWCPNCRRDMPVLNKLYEKYKDQIEVIGVNLQERESTVEKYITAAGITFPIALDPSGKTAGAYGIRYTNSHVLINKEGQIVKVVPGDISEADILLLLN